MRNDTIVCYDITDDKRRSKVFEVMRGHGDWLQYSVFRCYLTSQERVRLKSIVSTLINHREDQVLFIDLGPVEGISNDRFEAVGRPMPPRERRTNIF